jgi:hypothetical protein
MKTKDKVKKSSSRGVKELRSQTKRLEVERRRFVTLRLSTLDFSTRIRRNKARMSMKTKDEAKESSSRGVKESRSAKPRADCGPGALAGEPQAAGYSSTTRLLDFSTAECGEQSENV